MHTMTPRRRSCQPVPRTTPCPTTIPSSCLPCTLVASGLKYGIIANKSAGKTTLLRAIANAQVEGFPRPDEVRADRHRGADDGQRGAALHRTTTTEAAPFGACSAAPSSSFLWQVRSIFIENDIQGNQQKMNIVEFVIDTIGFGLTPTAAEVEKELLVANFTPLMCKGPWELGARATCLVLRTPPPHA